MFAGWKGENFQEYYVCEILANGEQINGEVLWSLGAAQWNSELMEVKLTSKTY